MMRKWVRLKIEKPNVKPNSRFSIMVRLKKPKFVESKTQKRTKIKIEIIKNCFYSETEDGKSIFTEYNTNKKFFEDEVIEWLKIKD